MRCRRYEAYYHGEEKGDESIATCICCSTSRPKTVVSMLIPIRELQTGACSYVYQICAYVPFPCVCLCTDVSLVVSRLYVSFAGLISIGCLQRNVISLMPKRNKKEKGRVQRSRSKYVISIMKLVYSVLVFLSNSSTARTLLRYYLLR